MGNNIVCPTESVMNIYNTDILWYEIEDFPGYEISNNGYVRSFKSANKYPYGVILKYYHKNGNYYEFTCSNNNRYRLTYEFIWYNLVSRLTQPVYGYQVTTKCRNSRLGILPNKPNDNPELEKLRVKSHKTRSIRKDGQNLDYNDLSFPSFNIPDKSLE
jgi:hypothetical protein